MPIDRTTLLRGPGYISVGSAVIHSTDNIVATLVEEWSDKVVSGFARTGRSLVDRRVQISATPAMWSDLATLFPYGAAQRLDSIYGATDVPLTITPRNGRDLVIANAAITQLANLRFVHNQDLFAGAVQWTGLVANNSSAGTLANFFAYGTTRTNFALPGFDPTKMPRGRYSAVRNAVTLRAETGFEVGFSLNLQPDKPDGEPTVNMRVDSLDATVRCRPVGLTEAQYLALLNDGVDIGDEPAVHNLVISGAGSGRPTFTLNRTMVEASGFEWGDAPRNGELTFASIRGLTSNLLSPLWSIGTTA
jgi:hypothetical protein